MKLFHSRNSPFVRKVMVVAHETGLIDKLQVDSIGLTPVAPHAGLIADNPLGKIPALVGDDGHVLFDSRVICEYLDSLHDGARLFPADRAARWTAIRRQALADGILDAAVNARYETALRPEPHRWAEWIDGQIAKVTRSFDALEAEAGSFGEVIDIGTISVGCAAGYLDFRYADMGWRNSRPTLAGWFEKIAQRPSFAKTAPPSP